MSVHWKYPLDWLLNYLASCCPRFLLWSQPPHPPTHQHRALLPTDLILPFCCKDRILLWCCVSIIIKLLLIHFGGPLLLVWAILQGSVQLQTGRRGRWSYSAPPCVIRHSILESVTKNHERTLNSITIVIIYNSSFNISFKMWRLCTFRYAAKGK